MHTNTPVLHPSKIKSKDATEFACVRPNASDALGLTHGTHELRCIRPDSNASDALGLTHTHEFRCIGSDRRTRARGIRLRV